MEMRRLASSTLRPERIILVAYWLVSGYGLRASRALVGLALTVVVFAVSLEFWGFDAPHPFSKAMLFSLESTIDILRLPSNLPKLSAVGELLQIGLRLLGPLFFGLTLLSLRGRVKR
jgi:hypothetical protein